jgi:hypothetical protein
VVYVGSGLGGAVVVYRKNTEGEWRLAGEDGGYLMREGDKRYVSRVPASGRASQVTDREIRVEADFYLSLHEDLKTYQMVALRILNSTVLRVQWMADLFRRVVVRRLMGNRVKAAARLRRTVILEEDAVVVNDVVDGTGDATLHRTRRASGIHMASSRYFQPSELEAGPGGWDEPAPTTSSRRI